MRTPICRIARYNKGSLSAIGREASRAEEHSRNQDIDKNRSHLNEVLHASEGGTLYRAWQSWREKHGCAGQRIDKDMTAFEGAVITASQDVFKDMGWDKDNPTPEAIQKSRDFLMTGYNNVVAQLGGDERILQAHLHLDETPPHIQLYYVPAVDKVEKKMYAKDGDGKILRNDKGSPIYARGKDGKILRETQEGWRINRGQFWADRGGKLSYNKLQTSFYEQMSACYPELKLERGQEGSTVEHTTKHQWERAQQRAELEELRQEAFEASRLVVDAKERVDAAEARAEALEAAVQPPSWTQFIRAQKTFTGAAKLPWDDFERLRETAVAASLAMMDAGKQEQEVQRLREELRRQSNRNAKAMQESIELAHLQQDMERLRQALIKKGLDPEQLLKQLNSDREKSHFRGR